MLTRRLRKTLLRLGSSIHTSCVLKKGHETLLPLFLSMSVSLSLSLSLSVTLYLSLNKFCLADFRVFVFAQDPYQPVEEETLELPDSEAAPDASVKSEEGWVTREQVQKTHDAITDCLSLLEPFIHPNTTHESTQEPAAEICGTSQGPAGAEYHPEHIEESAQEPIVEIDEASSGNGGDDEHHPSQNQHPPVAEATAGNDSDGLFQESAAETPEALNGTPMEAQEASASKKEMDAAQEILTAPVTSKNLARKYSTLVGILKGSTPCPRFQAGELPEEADRIAKILEKRSGKKKKRGTASKVKGKNCQVLSPLSHRLTILRAAKKACEHRKHAKHSKRGKVAPKAVEFEQSSGSSKRKAAPKGKPSAKAMASRRRSNTSTAAKAAAAAADLKQDEFEDEAAKAKRLVKKAHSVIWMQDMLFAYSYYKFFVYPLLSKK